MPRTRTSAKKQLPRGEGRLSGLKLLTLLADPTRLRLLRVLREHELSVVELQQCLRLGQSRISMHLAQLKLAGLLLDRREGQRSFYGLKPGLNPKDHPLLMAAIDAAAELPETDRDQEALRLVLQKRKETTEQYFNALAGRLGRNYVPGRSWEALTHLMLQMIPELVVADLGAGEGLVSQLLARHAKKVIAVDISPKMVEVGKELAKKAGLSNLEYRCGDIEKPPIDAGSVDVALLSQALHHAVEPQKALEAARRILKPGGRLLILDLNQHSFEQAHELYGDTWLGFAEADLLHMLAATGFRHINISLVSKDPASPHFQTLLASAVK